MSHFRQDIVTKHWVLIAPKRALRPETLGVEEAIPENLPEIDKTCVFCPGNESLNPDTVLALPNQRNWQVRVVPNKYEALSRKPERLVKREHAEFYISRTGTGGHEVVIMRKHNLHPALLPPSEMDLLIKSWQARIHDLEQNEDIRYVHIIYNHGKLSGASIIHPHAQIFAVPMIPEHLSDELKGATAYHNHYNRCVYCDMVKYEMEDGSRLVLETKDFLVFCLFAARVPFQLRLIPKRHEASFNGITAAERKGLAEALHKTLNILYEKLNNPSYNFYIHTLPVCELSSAICTPQNYHWHLEILPRINTWAGFELGTDTYVNPVVPEDAAKLLRS